MIGNMIPTKERGGELGEESLVARDMNGEQPLRSYKEKNSFEHFRMYLRLEWQ